MQKPKILHIGIFNDLEPQWSLRKALEDISSEYHEFDWQSRRTNVNELILYYADIVDVIFMQIQCADVVLPMVLQTVRQKCKVFNFSGDVRNPLPKWYFDLAPYCITLLTNNTDVETLKAAGHNAIYFQVGYNSDFYKSDGELIKNAPEICFMGNNYSNMFPLSKFRHDMVCFLQQEYGNRFQAYGKGYPNSIDLNYKQHEEAKIYRSAKIGINCSHFDYKQYSSDRMFRIMACGCFCLTHRFQDIEKEFTDGFDVSCWSDFGELKFNIDKFLINDEERERIADRGRRLVTSRYTWDYRMKQQFLQILNYSHEQKL